MQLGGGNYSLEEQVIGTWIDGKTIYQKTILCIVPSTATEVSFTPHNINNLGNIIDIKAYSISNKGIWRAIPSAYAQITNNSGVWNVDIFIDATDIHIQPGASFAADHKGSCYVTLQYTKTTD